MQWEETSPENQEDQIEAFFPTKERREAVTNNPVENNVCVWLSPLQRLGDAYFPSEEEAIVGTVKAGGISSSFATRSLQAKATFSEEYQLLTKAIDNNNVQTMIKNGKAVSLDDSKDDSQQRIDHSGFQGQTQVEEMADALARQLSSYMSAGWEGVHI